MNQRESIQKELEEIAPALARMDKNEPFQTPKGYFNQFPNRIHYKIREHSEDFAQDITLLQSIDRYLETFLRPAYAAALSVFLFIVMTGSYAMYLNQSQTPLLQQQANINELSSQEVAAYVSNHIDQFDVGVIAKDAHWQTTERAQSPNFTMEKLNNQELDQYIMANIDQETIQNDMR